jgi:hypothetical protein
MGNHFEALFTKPCVLYQLEIIRHENSLVTLLIFNDELIDLGLVNLQVGVCLVDSGNLRGIV